MSEQNFNEATENQGTTVIDNETGEVIQGAGYQQPKNGKFSEDEKTGAKIMAVTATGGMAVGGLLAMLVMKLVDKHSKKSEASDQPKLTLKEKRKAKLLGLTPEEYIEVGNWKKENQKVKDSEESNSEQK